MPALSSDDYVMQLPSLCGIHKDAVRCIFDERLNRLKIHANSPQNQLSGFQSALDDAYQFWADVIELPEERAGIKYEFTDTIQNYFERVKRYAGFHADEDLPPDQKKQKSDLIEAANRHINKLDKRLAASTLS